MAYGFLDSQKSKIIPSTNNWLEQCFLAGNNVYLRMQLSQVLPFIWLLRELQVEWAHHTNWPKTLVAHRTLLAISHTSICISAHTSTTTLCRSLAIQSHCNKTPNISYLHTVSGTPILSNSAHSLWVQSFLHSAHNRRNWAQQTITSTPQSKISHRQYFSSTKNDSQTVKSFSW